MADGFHEMPIKGKKSNNTAAPDATAVYTLPAVASGVVPTYTEGNLAALSTDLGGRLRVALDSTAGGAVDVTDRAGRLVGVVSLDAATVSALESVDLNAATISSITTALESVDLNLATRDDIVNRLSAALEEVAVRNQTDAAGAVIPMTVNGAVDVTDRAGRALGTVALDTASLGALESVDLNLTTRDDIVNRLSTALESVDLNVATRDDIVNRLSTNLEEVAIRNQRDAAGAVVPLTVTSSGSTTTQVRGAEVSDANPFPVVLQNNPGTLVDSGVLEAVNVAPGASAVLAGPTVTGATVARLAEITASSSVRFRVTLRNAGAGAGNRRVLFAKEAETVTYAPSDRDLLQASEAPAAGTTAAVPGGFEVVVTNLDNVNTASIYASITQVQA